MNLPHVAVCIPTIPPRIELLQRALWSVDRQDYQGRITTHISVDHARAGAAVNRNQACEEALEGKPEFLAFLDDDDELLPDHLSSLVAAALEEEADVVWPWFQVAGGGDPFPGHRGRQWNPEDPHIFPITALVRASAFPGFVPGPCEDPNAPGSGRAVGGEDWRLWLTMNAAGAKFHHINKQTWIWHHDSGNTSGLPQNWRS